MQPRLSAAEQAALDVMQSEAMLWLMAGANHPDVHIEQLRKIWARYVSAGGQTWGKVRT